MVSAGRPKKDVFILLRMISISEYVEVARDKNGEVKTMADTATSNGEHFGIHDGAQAVERHGARRAAHRKYRKAARRKMSTVKNSGILGAIDNFGENVGEILTAKNAKKAVAWYIDTSEKVANEALNLQARATKWAKETPLEPIFDAQHELGKKLIKRSVHAARSLWQLN
ncbi:MAG: hypothetical protein ACREQI_15565 [Candidatus Binataceae bacterium]